MKRVIDERLKHRIVGVVILLAIAAIFLPALMKQSNYNLDKRVSISVRLPEKPLAPKVQAPSTASMFQSTKVAHVAIAKVEAPQKVARVDRVQALPISTAAVAASSQAASAAKDSAARIAMMPAAVSKTASSATIAAKKAMYAVQLASFSQQKNARLLVEQLQKKGFKASYLKQGKVYNVLVGQVNHKDQAKSLQKQIADSMQLKGFIVKTGVS